MPADGGCGWVWQESVIERATIANSVLSVDARDVCKLGPPMTLRRAVAFFGA